MPCSCLRAVEDSLRIEGDVDAETAVAGVVAGPAVAGVVAGPALADVVAGAAAQRDGQVDAGRGVERVVARATGEPGLLKTAQGIGPQAHQSRVGQGEIDVANFDNGVDARAADQDVVAGPACADVVAVAAVASVVAGPAVAGVVAGPAFADVIAREAEQRDGQVYAGGRFEVGVASWRWRVSVLGIGSAV